jgi:glycine/D-amino acid oxidase-like deaminating enzyme
MKTIVVGGGVIGASVAYHLARDGAGEVLLVERDRLSAGTTWHSAGNITWKPLADHDRPILAVLQTVSELEAAGHPTGWLKTGRLFLGGQTSTLKCYDELDQAARAAGLDSRWLSHAEAKSLNPHLAAERLEGIWFNPLSGRLNPTDLTQAYACAAQRLGARILEGTPVLSIVAAGGRVTGVDTMAGRFTADRVVLSAGLWSRALLLPLGIHLAQWACEHFYILADVAPKLRRDTPSFVSPDDLIYGREEVGGLLLGCFDECAKTIDAAALPEPFTFTLLPPDWDKIAPYVERAIALFPALGTAPVRHFVNGPESFTPDGLPLIGPVPGCDGLIVATAMNSTGVTWSALAGSLVASFLAEREPRFPAEPYAPSRFGDRAADLGWLKGAISAIVSSGYRKAAIGSETHDQAEGPPAQRGAG